MADKNNKVFDEKYYEKKLKAYSKKKILIGTISAAVLIGGLGGAGGYFAYKYFAGGNVTQKDKFLRAFDRLSKGYFKMTGYKMNVDDFDDAKMVESEGKYILTMPHDEYCYIDDGANGCLNQTEFYYYTDDDGKWVDESYDLPTYYFINNKNGLKIPLVKNLNGNYYYETKGITDVMQQIKMYGNMIFNNFDLYTFKDNVYTANTTMSKILPGGTEIEEGIDIGNIKVEVNLEISDINIKKVSIVSTESFEFEIENPAVGKVTCVIPKGTIYMQGIFDEYNKAAVDNIEFIKANYKKFDKEADDINFSTKVFDTNFETPVESIKKGKEYLFVLMNSDDDTKYTVEDTCIYFDDNKNVTIGNKVIDNKTYFTVTLSSEDTRSDLNYSFGYKHLIGYYDSPATGSGSIPVDESK